MSDIYAKAFGGNFPVCSEQDKAAIEAGYKKAMEWTNSPEGQAYDSRPTECMCALIGRLLNGTASYGDMVTMGIDMARTVYARKAAADVILGLIEKARESELPSLDPTPSGKKEWVN